MMRNQFAFVMLGFIVGVCVMPLFYEQFYIPKGESFFYAYQAFVAGLLAFVAAAITIGYQHYKGNEQKRRVKRNIENELIGFVADVGNYIFPLEQAHNNVEFCKFHLTQIDMPQAPDILDSYELLSVLDPKDVYHIVVIKRFYSHFLRHIDSATNIFHGLENVKDCDGDALGIHLKLALSAGKGLCNTYDKFSESLIIEHGGRGSWTKEILVES